MTPRHDIDAPAAPPTRWERRQTTRAPSVREDVAPQAVRAGLIASAAGVFLGVVFWTFTGSVAGALAACMTLAPSLFALLLWRAPLPSRIVETLEAEFQRDFDGNGIIGPPAPAAIRERVHLVPYHDYQQPPPAYGNADIVGFLDAGFDAGGFSLADMGGCYNTQTGQQIDREIWEWARANVLAHLVAAGLFRMDGHGEIKPCAGIGLDDALAALRMTR